jgi:hypothetical protein
MTANAFHVRAVGDREFMQVGHEHGLVGIRPALLESGLSHRIDVNVVHAAKICEQRAPFVDDHRVHVEPLPITARWLEIVGRFRGE